MIELLVWTILKVAMVNVVAMTVLSFVAYLCAWKYRSPGTLVFPLIAVLLVTYLHMKIAANPHFLSIKLLLEADVVFIYASLLVGASIGAYAASRFIK
jgi:hypothetical protein